MKKIEELTCPIEASVIIISSKWNILIINELFKGIQRFGELKKSLNGISQKVLSSSLKFMEEHKLIDRKVFAQIPPKVEYSLTKLGREFFPVMETMKVFGQNFISKDQT